MGKPGGFVEFVNAGGQLRHHIPDTHIVKRRRILETRRQFPAAEPLVDLAEGVAIQVEVETAQQIRMIDGEDLVANRDRFGEGVGAASGVALDFDKHGGAINDPVAPKRQSLRSPGQSLLDPVFPSKYAAARLVGSSGRPNGGGRRRWGSRHGNFAEYGCPVIGIRGRARRGEGGLPVVQWEVAEAGHYG